MGLQPRRAGAAVGQHQRSNPEVEDVYRDLEAADVGVDADESDGLWGELPEAGREGLGKTGVARFGEDPTGATRGASAEQRSVSDGSAQPCQSRKRRYGPPGVLTKRVKRTGSWSARDQSPDAVGNVLGERVDESDLHIDDQRRLGRLPFHPPTTDSPRCSSSHVVPRPSSANRRARSTIGSWLARVASAPRRRRVDRKRPTRLLYSAAPRPTLAIARGGARRCPDGARGSTVTLASPLAARPGSGATRSQPKGIRAMGMSPFRFWQSPRRVLDPLRVAFTRVVRRPNGSGGVRWPLPPLLALLMAVTVAPAMAAQPVTIPSPPYLGPPPGFGVAETEHVRFLVEEGAAMDAASFAIAYGVMAERAHQELGTLFAPPARKVDMYVYSTPESFGAATANAVRPDPLNGEVLADPGVGDVALSLTPFLTRSPLEAENGLRHALAHVLVRGLSRWRLPRGFDDGLAQYAERPVNARLARAAALLQNASRRDALLTWSDLNRPQPPNADPALVAAHGYGVVAFLVERYGLRTFEAFVVELQTEPDWRTAMRTAYARSPAELEDQWRENLPRWTAGGWRENLFAAFDLEPARLLLGKAHYAAAKQELEGSLRLYTDLADTERQTEVEGLLRQGDVGLQAEALMAQIQQALERHTYDRAQTLLTQARAQYDQLPADQRPSELLATYEELAGAGLRATRDLDEARRLSHRWADYPQARAAAVGAGAAFADLGDGEMTDETRAVLANLDARQRRLVLMLGALAGLTIAWLVLWLWARGPAELDWSASAPRRSATGRGSLRPAGRRRTVRRWGSG